MTENIKPTELTDSMIENIVQTAESQRLNNMPNVEVNPDAELEVGYIDGDNHLGTSGIGRTNNIFDTATEEINDMSKSIDILTMKSGEEATEIAKESNAHIGVIGNVANSAKEMFDLSDDDVFKIINVLTEMNKNSKYPVFANLPEKLQLTISQLAYANKVPPAKLNDLSRAMMQEFIGQAGIDQALIDLEKALDDALSVPSIVDMYTEHTRNVMDNIIPQTIEKIKNDFPEKAERLEAIRNAFKNSYNFEYAKKYYMNNARIRKAMRRYESEYDKCMDLFNYMNEKSNFKMHDVNQIFTALKETLVTNIEIAFKMHQANNEKMSELDTRIYDLDVSDSDIKKFCIMLTKSCENMNPNDPVDAAYMYYMVRNIIVLQHTNEAKTDFAVELINNICDTITFIRDRESEFCESNTSKSAKKHASKNCE